jgi:amino acid transporter
MSSSQTKKNTHFKLGEFYATAICGNDILSSTLYVSGIAILFAGVYAPIVLLIIGAVLWLYKSVYTEVVEALPVNGGAYNCLLNGTSKTFAAIAGVMTILSYTATAVISAKIGVEYLHTILHNLPIILTTIGLLALFAILVISGIKDSAKVAAGIFCFHIFTLVSFLALGAWYIFNNHSQLSFNFAKTAQIISQHGGFFTALYLAFSASLLGVSGFESSANFVEEQKTGVFRKTLRNMLIGVAVFNPLVALVVVSSMPYDAIVQAKDFLLSDAARVVGGNWFQYVMACDAFLVLSGAVLTSFVGISGLVSRMVNDNCLPSFLNKLNSKGSHPRIIIAFFLLCTSILLLSKGNLLALAGVYTIAFLGVMSFFALGNLILKETRTDLKRTYRSSVLKVFLAFVATFFGILGNIRIDVNNLIFFELYFFPALVIIFSVMYHDYILRFLMRITIRLPRIHNYLIKKFDNVIQGKFVVFLHNIHRLHSLLQYIDRNETGWHITIILCKDADADNAANFKELNDTITTLAKAGLNSLFLNIVEILK